MQAQQLPLGEAAVLSRLAPRLQAGSSAGGPKLERGTGHRLPSGKCSSPECADL